MFVRRGIAFALGLSAVLFAAAAAPRAGAATQSLGRSLEKLGKEKKLKIAYFGGTNGATAKASAAWQAQTTAWFQSRAPQAKITATDATAEGGSEYGAFRFRQDIMERDPDLIFVEFAADDAEAEKQRTLRGLEGIVRQLWTSNPWAEIVFVYTTNKQRAASYERGEVPKGVDSHQAIARHYGIPEINVGRALAEAIRAGTGTWDSLTTDGRPNDAAAAIYFRAIEEFLAQHQADAVAEPLLTLPDPLTKDPFSGAYVVKGTSIYAPGWRKVLQPTDSSAQHIDAEMPGTDLVHTFTGSTVGVLLVVGPDGGDIEWSIDDGPSHRLSGWEAAAGGSGRLKFVILADDLKGAGEHKLNIRVHAEKQPQATDTRVRIAAIMMHCDC